MGRRDKSWLNYLISTVDTYLFACLLPRSMAVAPGGKSKDLWGKLVNG